ncbi:hypothetical protein UXN85_20695 [Enterobacter hormaechei]
MKTMLKATFTARVTELLSQGFNPELQISPMTCWGNLVWNDTECTRQVEPLFQARDCSPMTASRDRARFAKWFAEAREAFQAAEIEKAGVKVGVTVFDKATYTTRVVTAIRAGVLVLDASAERVLADIVVSQPETSTMKPEVVNADVACPMIPRAAIRHMVHTLAGAIEQSKKPGFNAEEAYADIKANYELVAYQCDDLATKVWLKNHLCFGYMGDVCTFEDVNGPYLKQFEHILETGWLPHSESGAQLRMSTLFEMDWWGADNITVTKKEGDKTFGTASITDTEGLYQIAFEWVGDQGELAESVGLPVLISITAARFTLPYEVTLTDCDVLEAIQEMDCVFGLSADIYNEQLFNTSPE